MPGLASNLYRWPRENVRDQHRIGRVVLHSEAFHQADRVRVGNIGAGVDAVECRRTPKKLQRRAACFGRQSLTPEWAQQTAHQLDVARLAHESKPAVADDIVLAAATECPVANPILRRSRNGISECLRGGFARDDEIVPEVSADVRVGPYGMKRVEVLNA